MSFESSYTPWWLLFMIFYLLFLCQYVAQAQLLINEIYASPPAGEDEWLEIYNPTNQAINLADWKIAENIGGTIKNHELIIKNKEATLSAQEFFLVVPQKVTLNNAGDTIYLFSPAGEIVDFITYPKLTGAQSYQRLIDGGSQWEIATPTKSKSNHLLFNDNGLNENDENLSSITTTTALNLSTPTITSLASGQEKRVSNQTTSTNYESTSVNSTINPMLEAHDQTWKKNLKFRLPIINYQSKLDSIFSSALAYHVDAEASMSQTLQSTTHQRQMPLFALTVIIISPVLMVGIDIFWWWYGNYKQQAETVVDF